MQVERGMCVRLGGYIPGSRLIPFRRMMARAIRSTALWNMSKGGGGVGGGERGQVGTVGGTRSLGAQASG